MTMRVRVVTGPPCSGKSTYVDEHANRGDLVIDLDRIAYAVGYPAESTSTGPSRRHTRRGSQR